MSHPLVSPSTAFLLWRRLIIIFIIITSDNMRYLIQSQAVGRQHFGRSGVIYDLLIGVFVTVPVSRLPVSKDMAFKCGLFSG